MIPKMSISVKFPLFTVMIMLKFARTRFSILTLLLSCVLAPSGIAQTKFFASVRPEASLVVRKHQMGADLVEVTVLEAGYPKEVLQAKVEGFGVLLKDQPRGLVVAESGGFLKASFAINGVVGNAEPRLNLVAIAQAFGFGNRPLRTISIFFDGLIPTAEIPARWFPKDETWMLEGVATQSPKGIEFRMKINAKSPNQIVLPGKSEAQQVNKQASQKNSPDFLLIGALIVGAIAVGLLVYSALIRPRQRVS
jgi:hypothetical protein